MGSRLGLFFSGVNLISVYDFYLRQMQGKLESCSRLVLQNQI